MNLPSIVNTLAALGANAPAARAPQQPQPGASFNQVLSREVAQRPPSQANARPQQASQQPARPQEAARPQAARANVADKARPTEATENAPAPAPAPADAPGAQAAQGADSASRDKPATEDGMPSLADIPGAPQAALMMQLMGSAAAATATTGAAPETGAADLAAAVGAKAGKDIPGHAPPDLRAQLAAAGRDEAGADGKAGPSAASPDLHAAFGKAVADAASQRPAHLPSAAQAEPGPAAPAATLAMLQAAVQTVQPAAAHAERLAPAVGTPAWDQALGQKIVWMAQGGEQSASLTMNPPDLGPMQVVLSVSNNQASVDFMAAQPEVREALESALPRLREMMSESGIQLGQANVSAGGSQQFAGFEGRNKDGSGPRGGDAAPGEAAPQVRQGVVRIARDGAVDTFA